MSSKEDLALIHIFNTRAVRMEKYFSGQHESLDVLGEQLAKVYGKSSLTPHITLSGLSKNQRETVLNIAKSYIANPASSVKSFELLQNKGFATFAKNQKLTREQMISFDRFFKSAQVQKLKELYSNFSKPVIDALKTLDAEEITWKDKEKIISDFMKEYQNDDSINIVQFVSDRINN